MSQLTVTLKDFPDIDDRNKELAERKFMQSLEKSFPDADALLAAFKIFQDASEGGDAALSGPEMQQAQQFHKAFDKARQAGFQHLGGSEEAYFDLRLD